MKIEEGELERLRVAFAWPAPESAAAPCADATSIWDAALGKLARSEARRLVQHSIECGECALAWRLAGALTREAGLSAEAEVDREQPPVVVRLQRRRRWIWAVTSTASGLAAAAAVLLVVRSKEPPPAPIFRSQSEESIRSLAPSHPLSRGAFVLRWSGVPAATRYSIAVTAKDLTPLHSAIGLSALEYKVPEPALAAVASGQEVVWTVTAWLSDGGRLSSPAFLTRLE